MSLLIDEYRKNWAIRYPREARIALWTAEETPTAVYYSLGDPSYTSFLVSRALEGRGAVMDSLTLFLVQMESLIRNRSAKAEALGRDVAIEEAKGLLKTGSEVVRLMVGRALKGYA